MLDNWDYKSFTFGAGSHMTREKGMCIMEAVAYVAGEPHSDMPECACPVLSKLFQGLNDYSLDESRGKLLGQYVFRLIGTRDPHFENARRDKIVAFAIKSLYWPTVDYHASDWLNMVRAGRKDRTEWRSCGVAVAYQANCNNRWPEVLAFLDELVGMTEVKEPGCVPNKSVEVANVS